MRRRLANIGWRTPWRRSWSPAAHENSVLPLILRKPIGSAPSDRFWTDRLALHSLQLRQPCLAGVVIRQHRALLDHLRRGHRAKPDPVVRPHLLRDSQEEELTRRKSRPEARNLQPFTERFRWHHHLVPRRRIATGFKTPG